MKDNLYITAIGASAGGSEALEAFFRDMNPDCATAYVIIHHLATSQKGFLKEKLSKISPLPVTEVSSKTKIKEKNIYIIHPRHYLQAEDGYLTLLDRDPETAVNNAIDIFFTSLAENAEAKAIGIILSGMGTDGTKGVRKIKEHGGVVMVQSPESAEFSNMPYGAIILDHPDFIGNTTELAEMLENYITTPEVIKSEPVTDTIDDAVPKIIRAVNKYSNVNFGEYKPSTILRRIDKRVKINRLYSLKEYVDFLNKNPHEVKILFKDLLIGVTEFFRDSQAFEVLRTKVIPDICSRYNEPHTLRIWVAACSTGEEAYSIAMLLEEHIQQNNLPLDFKLFATDLSQKAVTFAGRGQYTEQIINDIPDNLLSKYFIDKGDIYEINKELRKKIIFSVHNLLSDPPFIRLDLISCRNLFIYLKEDIQKKLLYTFNYSLLSQGYLMMGVNESNGELGDIFEKVDVKSKIFRNKSGGSKMRFDYISSFEYPKNDPSEFVMPVRNRSAIITDDEEYADILLDTYAADCILVTEENEIVFTAGNSERFLQFPNKRTNLNLFDMVSGSASIALRNGLNKVRETKSNVVIKNIKGFRHNEDEPVTLKFYSKIQPRKSKRLVIVEFVTTKEKGDSVQPIEVSSRDLIMEVERLETELYKARRELQYNSDELEAINEELQSSNEEMKSSNEEMQTTNEELQSTNEELKTVNIELQHKIDEITILHDDVNNLFISTQIATLFLDNDLRIRKYTPSVQKYFNIREGDIGRPLSHYTHNFSYESLIDDIHNVLETLQPHQKEIRDGEEFAHLKIIPYKTDDMRIEGVILTFNDITALKKANIKLEETTNTLKQRSWELEQSEKYWRSLVENSPDIIARLSKDGKIAFINSSILKYTDMSPEDITGMWLSDLFSDDTEQGQALIKQRKEVINSKKMVNFYQNFSFKGQPYYFYFTLMPECDTHSNTITHMLLVGRDITELRKVENSLEIKKQRLEDLNQYMDNFVHAVAHDLRAPITNLKLIEELIGEEKNPAKREALIKKIGTSVNRIDDILKGLIEIVDNQVISDEKASRVEFHSLIRTVLNQLPEDLEKFDIQTRLEVESIVHIRGYLYSILRNLISNAIKYRSSERPLKVEISTTKVDDYICMKVSDNGRGMDLNQVRKNLFKPFKRFNQDVEGKGIGLHLIKSMIEKTGGRIEVESEPDKGSTFCVYLSDL